MKILVAGASGVIGRELVPLLRSVGHDVVGLGRTARSATEAGHEVLAADAFDRAALDRAVESAAPDAVVHLWTSIPQQIDPKHIDRDMAKTNRLRTEGTRNLVAAVDGGARIISQGLAYAYRPSDSGEILNEDAPFWTDGPKKFRPVVEAVLEHERLTAEAGGLVLRFGHLYGSGTAYAVDGSTTAAIRAGRLPIVGDGGSVFSFTHARDAATAIVASLDRPVTGALNVVDDEPAPIGDWLPFVAGLLGAPEPKRVPVLLARAMVGEFGIAFMTRLPGVDNARARLQLDWRPGYRSWRDGFAAELAEFDHVGS